MTDGKLHAVVDYEDDYVQPLLVKVLKDRFGVDIVLHASDEDLPSDAKILQWRQYESIDFDQLLEKPSQSIANSYVIRKALIRKHYLANTVSHWLSKHPKSVLATHVQAGFDFELDYAEFLDDALLEAYELHESWQRNDTVDDDQKQWWILKPGMSDKGQGIRLFGSEEELTAIFEGWDPESDDEDGEGDDVGDLSQALASTNIQTSHLRHFVVQPYIDPPLLLPSPHPSAGRKFHIRTYVLAIGALKVYVFKPMLALFAGRSYTKPRSAEAANEDLDGHLTNTCLQNSDQRAGTVHAFWSLPASMQGVPSSDWREDVWNQICDVTAELFEAAARTSAVHFQPLPNAFEIFGLDFLVDAQGCAWLLEVNAFPDFAQTGAELSGIIEGLMAGVVEEAIVPFFQPGGQRACQDMVQVLDIDLGRR